MKKYTLIFALCMSLVSFAQYEITIKATLIDKSNNQPISYANIGFFNKSIGTVSNDDGSFMLVYDESLVSDSEVFQISSLGYETISVSLGELKKLLLNTNKIFLKPQVESLPEVVITNEIRKDLELGKATSNKEVLGYWKDKSALGGEIANKIDIRRKNTKLKKFKLYVYENQSDSLKIRVNIYKYFERYPKEKILKENVFHTIKIKQGEVSIDLEPYNIFVDQDFVIGIELIEVYGETIEFAISGSQFSGPAFNRYVSQDKWQRHPETGMNFSILTSVPSSKGKKDVVKRPDPKKLILYWDVSAFKNQKFIDKELELLSLYLKKFKNIAIEVIKFNDEIVSKKTFVINRNSIETLTTYLKESYYQGGIDYNNILKQNEFNADAILLFTNGASLFSELVSEVNTPIFAINSSSNANHSILQKAAFSADGHYVNLETVSLKDALNCMTNEVLDTKDYTINVTNPIIGNVVNANGVIQGATVKVKNTLNEVETDLNGNFKINALVGDDLVINFLGMLPKEIKATNSLLTVELEPEGELLDEVEVLKKVSKEEEVFLANGKKNKDAVGFGAQSLKSEDFPLTAVYLVDLIRGRFPGVRTQGIGPDAVFFVRGLNSIVSPTPAAFEVNGTIFREAPAFLNPQQIESITLLSSLTATNRYGSLGRGGVFKIELKTFKTNNNNDSSFNTALVTGNDYDESLKIVELNAKKSKKIIWLEQSKSYQEAISKYNDFLNSSEVPSISFYIEASEYFKRWDTDLTKGILEKAALVSYNNSKALKAIAYKLEENNEYQAAKIIYERIAALKPNALQTYRDLARILASSGDYDASMKLYKKMFRNQIPGLDFTPLTSPILSEIQNLVANHRLDVNYKDLPANLLSAKFNIDLRIVFEWNDPKTEFDIQFVNPKKKFYKWQHTLFDNKERLLDEVENGYHMEEYIIDDADSGEWIINIENFTKPDPINPAYLKYTVYKNYGLPSEEKTVKVIKLSNQKQKVTLDKFFYK